MRIQFSTVATLFGTELRMVFRDRRMVLIAILLPMVVMPLMLWGSTYSFKKRERQLREMTWKYAVAGPQAEAVRALLSATRKRLAADSESKPKANRFRFNEVNCDNPPLALEKGELQLLVEGLDGLGTPGAAGVASVNEPGALRGGSAVRTVKTSEALNEGPGGKRPPSTAGETAAATAPADQGETPVGGALVVRLTFRADRDESASCATRMQEALAGTRQLQRDELLRAHSFPVAVKEVAQVTSKNLASGKQEAGLALGRVITLFVLLFILSGGTIVATDSLAGEKERGTLETLLTTAATRVEVLLAKHLVIVAVALLIVLLQAANLLVYVSLKLIPVPPHLAAAAPPGVVVLLFLLYLPVATLAANILLLTSGYARTYKEAQMYFFAVFLLTLLPALAAFVPGIPLRSAILLVPIANLAVAAKQVLLGSFDWPMIALAWLVTAGASVWALSIGVRALSAEKLITAAERDAVDYAGGPALFERHVLRWFALLWALLIILSNYMSRADIRLQLGMNLVVVLFGGSWYLIRRYRLNPREALALRAPKPAVWLAVLCGVPGGLLTAVGVFRLFDLFLPISPEMMEQFSESVLPKNVPQVQLLFCLTVLPAIFEEIAFRGVLLHGLRRRLHPVLVALVVGVVFGLFHVALFRFAPTAFLGVILAAVTLLTGSIFPAMLWHCLSNALGVLTQTLKIPETELDAVCYLAGAGLLAVSFWVLWRNRTPYPELRVKSKTQNFRAKKTSPGYFRRGRFK